METWIISTGIAAIVAGILTIVLAVMSGRRRAESNARVEMLQALAGSDRGQTTESVQNEDFDEPKWPDSASADLPLRAIAPAPVIDRTVLDQKPASARKPAGFESSKWSDPGLTPQFVVTLPTPGKSRHQISFERR